MADSISGKANLAIARADSSGNVGYSLDFKYQYQAANPKGTIEYTEIEFSGPGSWEDFSEGDDYPYSDMYSLAIQNH